MSEVFEDNRCLLGEGPLWHPARNALFWFDIFNRRMFCKDAEGRRDWSFDAYFSAAGWIDAERLILASDSALWEFTIATGARRRIVALDAANPDTRSNDGRADPWGGFWIGTMGRETIIPKAGAIYRFYRGALRRLVTEVTVSNAICFAPDRTCAYYTDTVTGRIMRQALAPDDGWPVEAPTLFVDLSAQRLNPDGAVTDSQGNLWVALWGAARVACFAPDGKHLRDIDVAADQPTCPAFGGPDLRDLYVTSATTELSEDALAARPLNGATFRFADVAQGVPEPAVIV